MPLSICFFLLCSFPHLQALKINGSRFDLRFTFANLVVSDFHTPTPKTGEKLPLILHGGPVIMHGSCVVLSGGTTSAPQSRFASCGFRLCVHGSLEEPGPLYRYLHLHRGAFISLCHFLSLTYGAGSFLFLSLCSSAHTHSRRGMNLHLIFPPLCLIFSLQIEQERVLEMRLIEDTERSYQ